MAERRAQRKAGHGEGLEDIQAPFVSADNDGSQDRLEIDRFLSRLWKGRWLIVFSTLAAIALGTVVLVLMWGLDRQVAYQYVIQFTFSGRENSQYPNGTPFRLQDLLTPSVVAEVYRSNKLDEVGLSAEAFQEQLSVAPFVADREAILSRYETEYEKWITTAAELRELPDRAATELRRASQYSIMIELNDFDGQLPSALAAKVVRDIAEVWSRKAIDQLGVMRIRIDGVSPELFDTKSLENLEPLNRLRAIRSRADTLEGFVSEIAALPNGTIVSDKETGLNIPSLKGRLNDIRLSLIEMPVNWSRKYLRHPDAGRLAARLHSSGVFATDLILEQDYLVALDTASERLQILRKDIGAIQDAANGDAVTDPDTGYSAYDILQLLDDLESLRLEVLRAPVFELGISRNSELAQLHYESLLRQKKREREQLTAAANAVEEAREKYSGRSVQAGGEAVETGLPGRNTTIIPQFGDDFLDRLVKLSEKGGDAQFRQNLTREALSLQRETTRADDEIARVEQFLTKLRNPGGGSGTSLPRKEIMDLTAKRVEEELPRIFSKLEEYSDIARRISLRLRYGQEIHDILFEGSKNAPVKVDYFLRDSDSTTDDANRILADFRSLSEAASRIYDVVSEKNLGKLQGLYRPLGDAEIRREPLVKRESVVALLMAAVFGLLLGVAVALFRPATRRAQ